MKPEIYPSLLSYNYDEFATKLEMVEASQAEWAQIDVMDGTFVPARSVLPAEMTSLETKMNLEAHLMVREPAIYYDSLLRIGVKRVLLHREIYPDLATCAQALAEAGRLFPETGLVINPETEVERYAGLPVQAIQCMGVHPGASGQAMLESVYDTIKKVKEQRLPYVIAVDGGINENNILELRKVGVSRFIMSTAVFAADQPVAHSIQYYIHLITTGGV